jgi:hypothetical protein
MPTEADTVARTDAKTRTRRRIDTKGSAWKSAAIASLFAGIVMGLLLQSAMNIVPLIGEMYGALGLWTGWTAHLFHSVVFGLLYAAIATRPSLSAYASRLGSGAVVGAAYGVVVWVVAAGFVMPIWLSTVLMEPPTVPHFDPTSLVGHVVFGVLLGAGYAILVNR